MKYRTEAIRCAIRKPAAVAMHKAQVAVVQEAASEHTAHAEIAAARVRDHIA